VLLRAYREFEERVEEVRKRKGSKSEQVRDVVLAKQEGWLRFFGQISLRDEWICRRG
jgi:hypothetical protein